MQITISKIKYLDQPSSPAKLVTVPKEGQTFEFISQDELDKRSYTLSKRNGAGTYIVPTDKPKVYLNFIPKKTYVPDERLRKYVDTEFGYFKEAITVPPDNFTLPEGQIFRCVSETSVPTNKENYQYYTVVNGKKKVIPNYKTVEVMLAERNQTLLSVRVVPETECQQIGQDTASFPDKQSAWTEDFKDQTNFEILKSMDASRSPYFFSQRVASRVSSFVIIACQTSSKLIFCELASATKVKRASAISAPSSLSSSVAFFFFGPN
jgi:hypothetical protein